MEKAVDGHKRLKKHVKLLEHLEDALETPMVILGFVWLVLTIIDLSRGLPPLFQWLNLAIWAAFLVDFAVKLAVAPAGDSSWPAMSSPWCPSSCPRHGFYGSAARWPSSARPVPPAV